MIWVCWKRQRQKDRHPEGNGVEDLMMEQNQDKFKTGSWELSPMSCQDLPVWLGGWRWTGKSTPIQPARIIWGIHKENLSASWQYLISFPVISDQLTQKIGLLCFSKRRQAGERVVPYWSTWQCMTGGKPFLSPGGLYYRIFSNSLPPTFT